MKKRRIGAFKSAGDVLMYGGFTDSKGFCGGSDGRLMLDLVRCKDFRAVVIIVNQGVHSCQALRFLYIYIIRRSFILLFFAVIQYKYK